MLPVGTEIEIFRAKKRNIFTAFLNFFKSILADYRDRSFGRFFGIIIAKPSTGLPLLCVGRSLSLHGHWSFHSLYHTFRGGSENIQWKFLLIDWILILSFINNFAVLLLIVGSTDFLLRLARFTTALKYSFDWRIRTFCTQPIYLTQNSKMIFFRHWHLFFDKFYRECKDSLGLWFPRNDQRLHH